MKMVHIPYKGAEPAFTGLLGGEIAVYMSSIPPAVPMISAGRVRATRRDQREAHAARCPNVPTIAETGLPGLRSDQLVRRHDAGRRAEGHPRRKFTATSCEVLKQPDMQQRFDGRRRRRRAEHAGAVRGVHQDRDREVG